MSEFRLTAQEQIDVQIDVAPGRQGFRYFWAKRVIGFNPATHCYACLKGTSIRAVNLGLSIGGNCGIQALAGDLIYVCGVAAPANWANNFHLAFRVTNSAACMRELHTGAPITVANGEEIAINGAAAQSLFPERGPEFLTCRNFQFAAQMFGRPATPSVGANA